MSRSRQMGCDAPDGSNTLDERVAISAGALHADLNHIIKPSMTWNELIAEIAAVGSGGASDAHVAGIEYDSRRVRAGSVFVAMKGGSTDGNRYVEKAIASGALGII